MIIHGRKQISEMVYARKASEGGGAVRLTNMIRGGAVVFGELAPDVYGWLMPATKQAILGAFGVSDGTAVIKATNAYLTALAATDPTKAQALAGVINEDPMMVCSLGLSVEGVTMPIRWIQGDSASWIQTNYYGSNVSCIDSKVRFTDQYNPDNMIFGASNAVESAAFEIYIWNVGGNNNNYSLLYGTNVIVPTKQVVPTGLTTIWSVTPTKFLVKKEDGTVITNENISAGTFRSSYKAVIFGTTRGGTNSLGWGNFSMAYLALSENGTEVHRFIPYKHPTQGNGMLDLVNVVFYPNAGTGQFTIPDIVYTPSSQTP